MIDVDHIFQEELEAQEALLAQYEKEIKWAENGEGLCKGMNSQTREAIKNDLVLHRNQTAEAVRKLKEDMAK